MLWCMSTNALPPLPELETLHQRPSWVTWSGRIDRSACAELRVSDIRQSVRFKRVVSHTGCEARGRFDLTADHLVRLHRKRPPFTVQGDWRWKSHCMQPEQGWDREKRWRRSLKSLAVSFHPDDTSRLTAANPNKGAQMTKRFALPYEGWSQELIVERWCIGTVDADSVGPPNLRGRWDRKIRRSFLMCPGRELSLRSVPVWLPDLRRVTPTARQKWWWAIGREAYGEACTGKCYKLFLPLCTSAELRDSLIALVWLGQVAEIRSARRGIGAGTADEALIVARYGPLFHPRRLVCGRCLGLHYGKVKNQLERWRGIWSDREE